MRRILILIRSCPPCHTLALLAHVILGCGALGMVILHAVPEYALSFVGYGVLVAVSIMDVCSSTHDGPRARSSASGEPANQD